MYFFLAPKEKIDLTIMMMGRFPSLSEVAAQCCLPGVLSELLWRSLYQTPLQR